MYMTKSSHFHKLKSWTNEIQQHEINQLSCWSVGERLVSTESDLKTETTQSLNRKLMEIL